MRERLNTLIKSLDVYNGEECQRCRSYKYGLECDDDCFIGKVADYLISNDTVPVVRCKDCKYSVYEEYGLFCTADIGDELTVRLEDDFCSYGKRKDGD